MITRTQGFSLLEFLIYFFLVVLLSTYTVDFLISRYLIMMRNSRQTDCVMALCAAQDLLTHDIHHFFEPSSRLIAVAPDEYIWSGAKDIGWQVKNNRLIRSEGVYDMSKGVWIKRVKSIVAEHIAHISLEVLSSGVQSNAVRSTLETTHTGSIRRTVALRNRVLYA